MQPSVVDFSSKGRIKNMKTFKPLKGFFGKPLLCALLAVVGSFVLMDVVIDTTNMFESFLGETLQYISPVIQICVMTLYVLWIKKRLGNGFELGIRFDNLREGLMMLSATVVMIADNLSNSIRIFCSVPMEISPAEVMPALIRQILSGLLPGITEEFLCRVILMGMIMHLAMGKKHRLVLAVGTSSCVFGVLHLLNLFNGAPLVPTLFQVLYASAIGLMFAAVYARTRNILALMIAHSLVDISAYFYSNFYPSLAAANQKIESTISMREAVWDVLVTLLSLAVGFYLLRPSRHHEIEAHWGSLTAPVETQEV